MKPFTLNTERAQQARQEMPRQELSPPTSKDLAEGIQGVVQTASKANRALIAADVSSSVLVYYAGRVGRDLEDLIATQHPELISFEDRERLRRAIAVASDRLLRTESFARGCREQFLFPIEQQLNELHQMDEVVFVTHFN